LSILILSGCTNSTRESIETLHEGSFIVKAKFVDGRRNGRSEMYDSAGHLSGVLNYRNDSLSGICIHYFLNGVVSDSVMFINDKPQGYWKHYDQNGDLRYITYYYYGLQFGPEISYYKDRILKSFNFLNFEREPIVECSYNTHGNLDSIEKFDLKVVLREKEKNGLPVVELFAYLPQIPLAKQSYSIGLADKNHVPQKLCDIAGTNFLIDTVLKAPPPGFHFYLKCDVEAGGGFSKTHMIEMEKVESQVEK